MGDERLKFKGENAQKGLQQEVSYRSAILNGAVQFVNRVSYAFKGYLLLYEVLCP